MTPEHFDPAFAKKAAESDERRQALEDDFAEACRPVVTDGRLRGKVRMSTLVAVK